MGPLTQTIEDQLTKIMKGFWENQKREVENDFLRVEVLFRQGKKMCPRRSFTGDCAKVPNKQGREKVCKNVKRSWRRRGERSIVEYLSCRLY